MAKRVATTEIPYTELEVAGPYDASTGQGNFDESRTVIDRIIIHTMDGTWQGAAARFDNPSSNVSAHYGIKLDGGLVHWLEEYFSAYHAGDYAMNQRSIGIEHEDGGDYNGVRPDVLYHTSSKLVADICKFYGIPCDRTHIRKHNEVSDKPTGCPDALDIDRIISGAQAILNGGTPSTTPTPPTGNIYKGIDLTKEASVKAAIDTWDQVAHGQYVPLSDVNSICTTLGIPTGSSKDAINIAIVNLQNAKAHDDQTVQTLNQQIPALKTRAETAEGKVTTITAQLEDAQKAQTEPNSGQLYKDLYTQSESDLTTCRTTSSEAEKTYNRIIAQLKNQTFATASNTDLIGELFARAFHRK